jgi:hypothetical protein
MTPEELLAANGIELKNTAPGRYYTTCPQCSAKRSKAHQAVKVLGVTIEADGRVHWGCNHCGWTGPEKGGGGGDDRFVATYDYRDADGKFQFQKVKFPPGHHPRFLIRRSDGGGGWVWGAGEANTKILYRIDEVNEAMAQGRLLCIVEGEKDADRLWSLGIPATCNVGGAHDPSKNQKPKWYAEHSEQLRGGDIVVLNDNDDAGYAHADAVARLSLGIAARVRRLDLAKQWPDMPAKADVSDWLDAGHTREELDKLIEAAPDYAQTGNGQGTLLIPQREFLAGFVPPDYIVDGVLQRRFFYSLTAVTGGGKTALALLLAQAIGCADPNVTFGGHAVEKGNVVYFVGENPDDVRARLIGAHAQRNDDPNTDRIHYIVGVFDIQQIRARLESEIQQLGSVDLVLIDTSAAYFLKDDENSNPQIGAHARTLRSLTALPGGPCVLALCHPIKHVTDPSQLLPRGGGAFLAEVDGNLTAWKHDDDLIELHHNKIRGPGFEPISFRIEKIITPKLVDSKGRLIPTVRAVAISEEEEAKRAGEVRNDEDKLLLELLTNADRSQADLARACGFVLATGEPHKSKVKRIAGRLITARLAKPGRDGRWTLTDEGRKAAEKLKDRENETVEDRGGAASSKLDFFAVVGKKLVA